MKTDVTNNNDKHSDVGSLQEAHDAMQKVSVLAGHGMAITQLTINTQRTACLNHLYNSLLCMHGLFLCWFELRTGFEPNAFLALSSFSYVKYENTNTIAHVFFKAEFDD